MTSQVVLNNKQSTYGGPYGFYTVTLTPSNRTSNSVTIKCDVSANLQYGDSWTQMGVTCGLYVGGAWHNFVLVPYGMMWHGTTPTTTSTTITVTGLTESQTSITGIQFRALDTINEYEGPSLSATNCSNLSIDSFNGTADVMVPQVMLNEQQSTYGGPYGYYTVTLTPSNRTTNSVVVKCDVTAHLQLAGSYTQYGVTCGLYIGGAWHDFTLVSRGTMWQGTGNISTSTTITVTGLTASQTSITGIYFRAIDGASEYEGPSLSSTACPALAIISANGASTWSLSSTSVNVDGTLTASITPVVSTNYHTFKLSSGSNSTSFSSYSTSASLSIAAGVVGPWFGGSATSLSATLTMYTYDSGGIYLGESSKTVTIKMTSAAGAPANMAVAIKEGSPTKGTAIFTITPPATKYNASISSYSVTSNIGSVSRSGTTVTVSIPSGASSSTVTVSVTATDSRGYTTSASGSAAYNGNSTFTLNKSTINLGESITVSVDEWVASNTYTLAANGVTFVTKGTGSSTSCSFSAANFGSLFSSTSKTATTTLTCTTYDSSGAVKGTTNKTITLNMTEALGAPTDFAIATSKIEKGMIMFAVLPPNTKYGATISGYTATTNIGTISVSGITAVVTIPSGASASTVNISITATDTRGYTITANHSEDYNGASIFTFDTTSVRLDGSINVAVDEWVAANTYSLSANGVTFANKATNNNASCNFSAANFGSLFGNTSTTATTTVTCSTFDSSGVQVGSSSTKTINLTMTEAIGAPTGAGLTITSATSTQIVATIIPPTTKYGATISNYVVTTSSGTASRSGNTITVTNSAGFGNSKVQISVYAVDSRGFKSNTAVAEKLNTVPKILLNGASYEKIISHGKNVVAIYSGSTRIM